MMSTILQKNKKSHKNRPILARIATFCFFAFFMYLMLMYIIKWNGYSQLQNTFEKEGVRTLGKVVSVSVNRGSKAGTSSVYPTVEFSDIDETIHSFRSEFHYSSREGDNVNVVYLANDPEVSQIENAGAKVFCFSVFAVHLFAFIFSGFLFACAFFYDK